ncbi:MAG: MaoC family dehydratase [Micromonosporaceae bacterium]|nr:MaoC family dehydratase [Micromonosporaceae bacterium]
MTDRHRWEGRFLEDFVVGDIYEHPIGRTITTADNMWFTLLTQNTARLHIDHHYSSQTAHGQPLVNSALTLAVATGQSVMDVSQNVFANLGWDDVRLVHPVFEGDTIYSESEVLSVRESKSRPSTGIVRVRTRALNQKGEIVLTFHRTVMVYQRGEGPVRPVPADRPPDDELTEEAGDE